MAKSLSIAAGGETTETFYPNASFLVYGPGIPTSTTFQIQMRPKGVGTADWVSAVTANHLEDSTPSAGVSGSRGFEYRIHRTAGTTTAARTFYWDHVTTLESIYYQE